MSRDQLSSLSQRKMQPRLRALPRTEASFVEPMECLSVSKLPEGLEWLWEIKFDGYRALAVKSGTGLTLFSRRRKSLNRQFPFIVEALADLPAGTVVDGEVVAIDESGRPSFNLLQHSRAGASRIQYYVFDLLCWKDRDLTHVPLEKMKKAVWLRPDAVAQIEFLEWTEGDRLRHSKFVGLREDKNPRSVVKEQASEPE